MELLEQLELVNVEFDGKKAILTFLDESKGEIREVNFNKQSFDADSNKFIDDPEKEEKVEKWCEEFFSLPFDRLAEAIGERKDIYAYDKFNSLFEVEMVEKFEKDMVGQIMEVEVTEVIDDEKAIKIRFEYNDKTYENKMGYADYLESKKQWFINPIKRNKQYAKFEDKFGITIADKQNLVGQKVMVEVKLAFNKFVYADVKPFPKNKR